MLQRLIKHIQCLEHGHDWKLIFSYGHTELLGLICKRCDKIKPHPCKIIKSIPPTPPYKRTNLDKP